MSYLGIPLITGDDQAVGTLCVLDSRPREWTADDVKVLGDLAAILMDEFGGGRRSPGRHAVT